MLDRALVAGIILHADKFRHQGQHPIMARCHDHCRQHGMEEPGTLVFARVTHGALLTMDRPGGMKLDAVQRHEHAIGKTYKRRKVPLGTKRIQQVQKQALKRVRNQSVQQVADLTIGGNALHAEQRLTVGAGLALLHPPLEGKKGRRLQKEAGKRTQDGIGESVAHSLAFIRERIGGRADAFQHMAQDRVGFHGRTSEQQAEEPCIRASHDRYWRVIHPSYTHVLLNNYSRKLN